MVLKFLKEGGIYPVLQPLVSVDVETLMGPMSAQVHAHGGCFVTRGYLLPRVLHDSSIPKCTP